MRRRSSDVYDCGDENENERPIEGEHEHRWDYLCEGLAQKTKCGECGFFVPEHQGCYACCGCYYAEAVHKTCADLPRRISRHPLHASHTLILKLRRRSSTCYYCQEALRGGPEDPYYTCQSCETDEAVYGFLFPNYLMHAACALIPLPAVCGEGEYVCHQRRMLLLEEGAAEETTCFSCGSQWWGGRAYRCTAAPLCRNFFHGSCAELPPRIRFVRQDPDRDLELAVGRPETCWVCGRRGCRHVYYCELREVVAKYKTLQEGQTCHVFALGAECVFHGSCLALTSHKHGLLLVEDRPAGALRCDACWGIFQGGAVLAEVRRTGDVSFRCQQCVFNLYFLCGPLPSVVKFDYHIHPLHLVNLLVEDGSGEYYCDVCEEERDLRFRVYHCADCNFVAHIHCLVSQIMKLLKDESNTNVEFLILGESSQNGSTETDRESTEQESTLGQDNPTEELFFRDIVDHLTEDEKAKLDLYTLDSSTDHKIILSGGPRFIVSFLDGNEGPNKIEYLDIAEEYFNLDTTGFSQLCSELSHLKPDKLVLELDDKYLSMKVIDVGGYMVPWAFASDLKMLLQKYGDLGGDSSLTQQMKSFTATLICATVNRMRNTLAEDMSMDYLKYWCYNLSRIKKIAGYKVKELECFEESVITTFLGFEAIRFKKEANESLDLKIAKLKAGLEDCEGKREKLKEFASIESDFMKECLRKASGSKWKTVDKLF